MEKIIKLLSRPGKKSKLNQFGAEIRKTDKGETLRNYFVDKKDMIKKSPVLRTHYLGILQS